MMRPQNDQTQPASAGRERATEIRQARATRVRRIRKRVIGGAAALFAAAWLMIAVSLAAGHDPALATRTATTAAGTAQAATSTTPITTTTSPTTTTTATTTTPSTASTATTGNTGSGVTTRQS